jgi:adenylate cyclase class 2
MIEYEVKVLDIPVEETITKLLSLGAQKTGDYFMKRWMYEIDPIEKRWLRLRNDGEKTVLTYKHSHSADIAGMEEIETGVEDFDKAVEIFAKLNFSQRIYQENKRVSYRLNGIEFDFDTWPMIPTFLEIESSSSEKVQEGLTLLDLTVKSAGNISTIDVYRNYGLDLHSYQELKF